MSGFLNYLDKFQNRIDSKIIPEKVVKKTIPVKVKQECKVPFKIKPKQVVKSKIVECRDRAMDILDGLPETPILSENINNGDNQMMPIHNEPPVNLNSVAGHASELL
jgi:hypothetical protein